MLSVTTLTEPELRPQNLSAEYAQGVLTLTVSGDIDHHSAAALRRSVDREIFFYHPRVVLLRLDGVDFMDSAGLGFFMGRYQLCTSIGAAFRLVDPPERIVRILHLSGMDRKLSIDKVYRPGGEAGRKEKTQYAEEKPKNDP